jgi:hypothetical protein
MTKKELVEMLSVWPDDYLVILSSDGEGNSFSPVSKPVSVGMYEPDSSYSGEFFDREELEEGDIENCIVLWPIN